MEKWNDGMLKGGRVLSPGYPMLGESKSRRELSAGAFDVDWPILLVSAEYQTG
jgi:hypothetical protein